MSKSQTTDPISMLIAEIKRMLRGREHIRDEAEIFPLLRLKIGEWRAILRELDQECKDAL